MRILYLSNVNNYHTIKWCKYFSGQGYDVHVAGFEKPEEKALNDLKDTSVYWLKNSSSRLGSECQKLGYFFTIGQAKRLIKELSPDVIHAHYASSYGLICSFSCSKPYYLSVWGSDIYNFPKKSILHRSLIKRSLNHCSWLFSTSKAMAQEAKKYTNKEIEITPFGVDTEFFTPRKRSRNKGEEIVVGVVKGLEEKYGIDILLTAIAILKEKNPELSIKVRIAGTGTKEKQLKDLAKKLGIDQIVDWLGQITQEQAAVEWANFDIAVISSIDESESFGVSAVEAQACATPLIISDVPGLVEACDGGKTALVVPHGNAVLLAESIDSLIACPEIGIELGRRARAYVQDTYELDTCFKAVEKMYHHNLLEAL